MTLTIRHKVFGVAFTLAVAILLVDRLFVLPRGAGAASLDMDSLPEPLLLLETLPDHLTPAKTRTVAERLETLCPQERLQQETLPDAFSLPAAWLADVDPNGSLLGGRDSVVEFRKRYELLAVAESNGSMCAFVNHYRLQIGQTLQGFTLVDIDDRSATFAGDGIRFVLRLKEG